METTVITKVTRYEGLFDKSTEKIILMNKASCTIKDIIETKYQKI